MRKRTPLNDESSSPVVIRFAPEQRRVLQREADAVGMPLGAWVRTITLAAAGSSKLDEQIGRAKQKRNELRKSRH